VARRCIHGNPGTDGTFSDTRGNENVPSVPVCQDFAKDQCDKRYGKGNYNTGPDSEYNKIKKWADRK
jgi:hypothetical protein